jgi:plasmid stabilization system protein ParE
MVPAARDLDAIGDYIARQNPVQRNGLSGVS